MPSPPDGLGVLALDVERPVRPPRSRRGGRAAVRAAAVTVAAGLLLGGAAGGGSAGAPTVPAAPAGSAASHGRPAWPFGSVAHAAESARPAARSTTPSTGGVQAASPGESRATYIAAQLRRDPVYVSPSLTRVASPAAIASLRKRVAGMPFPTFVAVVPQFDDEPDLEILGDLLPILRDQVGRSGLYVVADGAGYGLDAEAFGVRTAGDTGRASLVASDGTPRGAGPLERVDVALRHLATGYVPTTSRSADREARDRLPWIVLGVATALGFFLPVGVVLAGPGAWARRRSARAVQRQEAARAVERGPRLDEPSPSVARGEALDDLAALARAIAEDPSPADRAVRAYDAASHVMAGRRPRAVDLVGAGVLARAGRSWLRDPGWRPCFFDPRHGQGDRTTRWRRGTEDITIPTCDACAKAVRNGTEPRILGDRGRPYFEQDTVWARTGFGALDDDVTEIVLAGPRRST